MPEGDTIWRAARTLDTLLAGREFTGSDFRVPAFATLDLVGRWLVAVRSRGKHLLMDVSAGPVETPSVLIHSTLGMEGSWRTFAANERWRGGPGHRIRAVLRFGDHTAVGYRLSHLDVARRDDEARFVGHLGPDLLGPDWSAELACARLRADPGRAIADALLDQRALAGIGNVFKSEILFIERVYPWAPVADVADLASVVATARELLLANRNRGRRVTTGDPRRPSWVYGRGGLPCRRCGTRIRVAEQGPATRERWTWRCPECQPATM